MHRYFLIPMIGFFLVILGFVIYFQFINENWKYLVPKPEAMLESALYHVKTLEELNF